MYAYRISGFVQCVEFNPSSKSVLLQHSHSFDTLYKITTPSSLVVPVRSISYSISAPALTSRPLRMTRWSILCMCSPVLVGRYVFIETSCRYVARDGGSVLTGDSNGNIKTWQVGDLSHPCIVDSMKNDKSRPISHLHVSPSVHPGEEGRFLAVNSYDNGMTSASSQTAELVDQSRCYHAL